MIRDLIPIAAVTLAILRAGGPAAPSWGRENDGVMRYSTTFEGDENPLSEGGKWTNNGMDWTTIRKIDGLACGTQTGTNKDAHRYDDSYAHLAGFPPDQEAWGQVQIARPNPACHQEVEILLRWTSSPHSTTGYECFARGVNDGSSYVQIVRWEGPLGKFTYLADQRGADYGLKDGDILKASIVGNVITVFINGVEKAQVKDDTYKTGDPGIGTFLSCDGGRGTGSNRDFGFKSFTARAVPQGVAVPQIVGPWWQVAGNPMDHKYTAEKQEPVDFAVWQAADGTWQLWSCLRGTTAGGPGGRTRFFYRWEGQRLTDSNWQPLGIAMEADPALGETPGGLQAPHVIRAGDTYHLFYGDWVNLCHATSRDGKTFTRVLGPTGKTGLFSEGPTANTRDIMLLAHGGQWYAYYTCHPNNQGMDCLRTTSDFRTWTEATVVASGGRAGTGPYSAECPHVVKLGESDFYLFRTQSYGNAEEGDSRKRGPAQTSVYHSPDPTCFGINQDGRYFLCTLPVAAPEIILHEGQYYLAALNEGALNGIRITRLQWIKPR